jgi:hypothetical protein
VQAAQEHAPGLVQERRAEEGHRSHHHCHCGGVGSCHCRSARLGPWVKRGRRIVLYGV